MSGNSSVGQASVYEAKDQRTSSRKEEEEQKRFHEGQKNAHKLNDPLDQRSLANRAKDEEQREKEDTPESEEVKVLKQDPTLPAKLHGNKPSRGAEIDAQLQAEEEAELKRKGKA
ncbi:hypothetical protein HYALB_00001584 [Hymenoscyphus albidus]|uniref:Uncharacterized protein n=1 Tax=Hymenoscyphus albidus TaxID=595503 RepID=A0A9N9LDQ1_9HELO|nr:hypothetical protein HYALB_00001584 [Hymenoscyphus albidus]